MVETHLLSPRRNETPTFEDVYLTAQASIQMPVVFETIACAVQNPFIFPRPFRCACDFRFCWSAMYTVENETKKSEISASVGLARRGVS